jgi:hypothetical protein
MDPMFDITRGEENVQEGPRIAEEFVRGQGHLSLKNTGETRGRIDKSERYLRFPDDAVLLMTGTTGDLLKAYQQAVSDHIQMIGTESDQVLKLLFARVSVAADQTDTLLAIGSNQGPLRSVVATADGWKVATVITDYAKYLTTHPRPEDNPTQPLALPTMLNEIKRKHQAAWIKSS